MSILEVVDPIAREAMAWRRDLHANPELLFDLPRTSAMVAEKLRAFGCDEVVSGIAQSGVVGLIHGQRRDSGRMVGLRADMDALPMREDSDLSHRSIHPERMHACGHDGHTAMLLGAARQLSANRLFDGTAVLIFQPAEEGGGGGRAMIEEGLLERFPVQEVYALHSRPGLAVGRFALRDGPILAAADRFIVRVKGRGGHAAMPHNSVDPVHVAAQMTVALQSVVSRNVDPLEPAVLTVAQISGGSAMNVIADDAELRGTARTFAPEIRALVEQRLREIVELVARTHGARAEVEWLPGYPVTSNDPACAARAAAVASSIAGSADVDRNCAPLMAAEDFSYMLEKRPGAFMWIGNGDSAALHHPRYDFNDEAIAYGISYWTRLVETLCPLLEPDQGASPVQSARNSRR